MRGLPDRNLKTYSPSSMQPMMRQLWMLRPLLAAESSGDAEFQLRSTVYDWIAA